MTALAFTFSGSSRAPLAFNFEPETPVFSGAATRVGGRYSRPDLRAPFSGIATRRGRIGSGHPTFRARGRAAIGSIPPAPFGYILPKNVRAGGISGSWRSATTEIHEAALLWRDAGRADATLTAPIRPAVTAARVTTIGRRDAAGAALTQSAVWGKAEVLTAEAVALWKRLPASGTLSKAVWRDGKIAASTPLALPFFRCIVAGQLLALPWHSSIPRGATLIQPWRSALPTGLLLALPWRPARTLGSQSWPFPPLPELPIIPARPLLRFDFHAPARAALSFSFGREPAWVIPIQRSYAMIQTMDVVTLPGRVSIPLADLTLSSAWDEWAWSLTATLDGPTAVDLLRPVVAEAIMVEADLNGYLWQFRIDQVSGTDQFNNTGGQAQGTSRAALLGPDVALAVNGYEEQAKTAKQLAEQELIGTDWQIDWGDFPDWLVPAGTYSYSQKTPIEVITQIVGTAGYRVVADRSTTWLHVLARYPLPIWDWPTAEPDIVLPRAIMKTLGWKPRAGRPWDAVYLGDGSTVLAKARRSGRPGSSVPDSPVIEALLCHLDVCRPRGIAYISDVGAGVDFTLQLPLSSVGGPSPLRAVGELVRFEDGGKNWIGLITSISIRAAFGAAFQTLEVRAVEAI